jgi:hypothetical protein
LALFRPFAVRMCYFDHLNQNKTIVIFCVCPLSALRRLHVLTFDHLNEKKIIVNFSFGPFSALRRPNVLL